ncbi:MAG: hypothetical protein WBA76_22430, partial [Phormidesmis sp.]
MAKRQAKKEIKRQITELSIPQRTSEGFVFTASVYERYTGIVMAIFGLSWSAIALIPLLALLQLINVFSIFLIAFVGLFEVLGLLFFGSGLLQMWTNLKLHPAELVLPKYPLRLGETCPLYYRRRLRKGTLSASAHIKAQLVCDEWVQYSEGTDTISKTHELWKKLLPERSIVSGERQADYSEKIEIPSQYPPSFYAKCNQVRWLLTITLKIPGI